MSNSRNNGPGLYSLAWIAFFGFWSEFSDWALTSSKITRAEFNWLQDILDSVDRLYDEGCFGDAYHQALRIIRFQFNRAN